MTNIEFVRLMMRQNPGMLRDDAWKITQLVFAGLREAIGTGESLIIPGIGTLYPEFLEERELKSNLPKLKGRTGTVPPCVKLRFRASKKMERHLTKKLLGVSDETESV
jgi:nucleoid DNA-binding protein